MFFPPPLSKLRPRFDIKSPELFFKRQPLRLPACARAAAYQKAVGAVGGDAQVFGGAELFLADQH